MFQPLTEGGPGVHDLDFDGSDIDTALPDDDDDVVSFEKFSAGIRAAFLSQVGVFVWPRAGHRPFFFFRQ